jgi:hypothetical protein
MGLGADAETMAALAASGGAVGNSLGCRARLQSARALDARINEDKEAAAADEAVPATAEETTTATSLSTPATPPSSPAVSSSTLQALGLVGLAEPEPEPELTESCSVVGVLSSSLCAAAGGIGGGGGGGGLGSVAVAKALLTAATTKQKRKKKRRKRNVVSRLYQTPPAAGGAGAGAPTTPTPSAKPRAAGIIKSKLMGGMPSLASSGGSAVGLPSVTGGGNSHPTLATVVKAAQKKYTGADTCRDLRGKRYDIKEFRERRNRAVLKGMKYMKKYLLKNNCAALFDIGDDAPSIFFEIWYTSANSDIRVRGKETARVLLDKLITQRLARVGDDVVRTPPNIHRIAPGRRRDTAG